MKLSIESFITVLQKSGLVEHDRLQHVLKVHLDSPDRESTTSLADRLVEGNLLTKWQIEKLLQGKHRGYFLGKYKLLSLLGKGGMSSVYLAEHLLMRRRCALKVLPAKRVDDSSYLERFLREAQAAASLDHPNIVRAYDVDHQNDGDKQIYFLVMEYIEGTSLQDLVTGKGVSSFLDAAEFARQAALGLQHAHNSGMVHRDIKPGNLLVDSNGLVKILDLGLARFFTVDEGNQALTLRHDERVLGTADYLAPEQALDSHTVDFRADIYALGCTLYFMLTGQPPFTEGTLAQRLLAHQVKTPPMLETLRLDVPTSLAIIVRKMMEKNPDDRFSTAAEVEHALFNWVNENADAEWRKSHSDVYESRASGSSIAPLPAIVAPVAVPVAMPAATAAQAVHPATPSIYDLANNRTSTSESPAAGSLKSASDASDTKPFQMAETMTRESKDSMIDPFFSSLAQFSVNQQDPQPKIDATSESPVATGQETSSAPMADDHPSGSESSPENFGFGDLSRLHPTRPKTRSKPTSRRRSSTVKANPRKTPSSKKSPKVIGGILGIAIIPLILSYQFLSSSGSFFSETKIPPGPEPFPKDKREIIVGGPKGEFKHIRHAIEAVRSRFKPTHSGNQRLVIRISPGEYKEQIHINGHWPQGITIKGEGIVRLSPDESSPVIQLKNVPNVSIENVQIDATNKPVAVELSGDMHDTKLRQITIRGFSEIGVLCRGAQGLAFTNSQVLLDRIRFEAVGTTATGVKFQDIPSDDSGSPIIDTNNVVVRGCRFMTPMSAGIEIGGRSPFGINITENIFHKTIDGVRFQGESTLNSIQVINNSFHETKKGIHFVNLPNIKSTSLAFRRNLFVKTQIAEAIVDESYDEDLFQSMLVAPSVGIENNWSDRPQAAGAHEGQIAIFFENGGASGDRDFALASTDPKHDKFLAPTEKSPQRDVPGSQPSDNKWVGAIGP